MSRVVTELWPDAIGAAGTVIRYGHWGRPVLVFPSGRGRAWDFEDNGMAGAVQALLESTRRLAGLLEGRGIRHELDPWGHDVPRDWPSWRAQVAHHLPRFS